jgi:hypothetical protein
MNKKVEGSCLCGSVIFTIELPSLWCAHCHCSMCQRGSGSAFVTWVGVPTERLVVHRGEALRWIESSPGAERGFCGGCGSPMFFRSARWPGEVHVTLANLKSAIDRAPQMHVFYDTHVDWVQLADSLPRKSASEV